jgi:hypothetical protein
MALNLECASRVPDSWENPLLSNPLNLSNPAATLSPSCHPPCCCQHGNLPLSNISDLVNPAATQNPTPTCCC